MTSFFKQRKRNGKRIEKKNKGENNLKHTHRFCSETKRNEKRRRRIIAKCKYILNPVRVKVIQKTHICIYMHIIYMYY